MNRVRAALAAAIVSTATIGCSAQRDVPTAAVTRAATAKPAPQVPPSQLRIVAVRPTQDSCRSPGETIPGPTVLVTDSSGAPAANVSVSFQVLSGNGTLGYSSATTDASGLAGPGSWTLGSDVGVNFMHARIADGGGVDFSVAAATTAKVVAVYQLQSIGGQSLPRIYPDWTITGGHYYVAANGTYSFGYEFGSTPAPATICSSARYVVGSSGIDFYLAPGSYPESSFYQQRGGLFSTGTLSGASLSVKYMDVVDFDDERYALVSGSVAPLMPTK